MRRLLGSASIALVIVAFAAACSDPTGPAEATARPELRAAAAPVQESHYRVVPVHRLLLGKVGTSHVIEAWAMDKRTGRGVPGLRIRFTVVSGGGRLSATTVVGDAHGHAHVVWTFGPLRGTQIAAVQLVDYPPVVSGDAGHFVATVRPK